MSSSKLFIIIIFVVLCVWSPVSWYETYGVKAIVRREEIRILKIHIYAMLYVYRWHIEDDDDDDDEKVLFFGIHFSRFFFDFAAICPNFSTSMSEDSTVQCAVYALKINAFSNS